METELFCNSMSGTIVMQLHFNQAVEIHAILKQIIQIKLFGLYGNCRVVVQGLHIHLSYVMYIHFWSMYVDFFLYLHISC
jgi:hypothetical protein